MGNYLVTSNETTGHQGIIMMRVRFVKNYQDYLKGEEANLPKEEAFKLQKKGIIKVDRMLTKYEVKHG